MLASSQYLHPDYLQPLPTTLDAKKSPLALLAQTCSSIGKDTSPSKPLIPPLERKDHDKSSPGEGRKSNERRGSGSSDTSKPFRAPPPKDIPPLVPINNTHSEKSSKSPSVDAAATSKSPSTGSHITTTSQNNVNSSSAQNSGTSRISLSCGNVQLEVNHSEAVSKSGASGRTQASPVLTASTPKHAGHPLLYPGVTPGALPYPSYAHLYASHGYQLDAAAAATSTYHAALAAHGGLGYHAAAAAAAASATSPLKSSHLSTSSATSPVSPYISYARVKTAGGDQSLIPVCRDPYCTTCQISMQSAQLSAQCTIPGCTQCGHHKPVTSLNSSLSLPILPSFGGSGLISTAGGLPTSLYAHGLLSTAAAHTAAGMPYVCNWVAGSDYCGKRFPSSEELLQHLRTHTSASDSAYSSLLQAQAHGLIGGLGGGLSLPTASALAAAHYPSPPLSPNTLRRLYPTSLSPVSSRYHPYSKPASLTSLGAPPAPTLAGLSALGPLYSPYAAFYGQKLGAALP